MPFSIQNNTFHCEEVEYSSLNEIFSRKKWSFNKVSLDTIFTITRNKGFSLYIHTYLLLDKRYKI